MSDENQSFRDFVIGRLEGYEHRPTISGYGVVKSSADSVVSVEGLGGCKYAELIQFENGAYGMAMELFEDGASVVMLTDAIDVKAGSIVVGTGRVASIGVSDSLIGRIVNPIGSALEGSPIEFKDYRNLEMPAPSIVDRSPVNTPLETGILAIDAMIPIGRGQRELVIGDRQTGKTSIALSAISNQVGKGVICVYCAIGQKSSSIASAVETLRRTGSMEYTVVVASTASDSAALQYLAPYSACTIAEYFMAKGKDVLVIYDDLSKHAVAYREMSLLLRRPSGREAYPGDVFYLHSRLLERAAKLSAEKGGGSITALPIVETQAGDISAYIPTNVISITDGQIYLESDLFNSGQRPAINVGLSVSRVGRSAQHDAMKKVSSNLRLDVAQYRDMAVFAQFGADIDASTAVLLRRGERLMELLKQSQRENMTIADQAVTLLAFNNKAFDDFELSHIQAARIQMLAFLKTACPEAVSNINATGKLSDEDKAKLTASISTFVENNRI
jgi:F-type H+-transporting ATPase subunit alpha